MGHLSNKKEKKQDVEQHQTNAQAKQDGSPSMSRQDAGKHKKDNSDGADKNTTKKQQNGI